jgi:uncharacterized membrane protein YgcG
MKKILCVALLAVLLVLALALPVSASSAQYVVYDDAGLLDNSDETILEQMGRNASQNMGGTEIHIIVTPHFSYDYEDAIRSTHYLSQEQDMILLVIYWDSFRDYYEYEVVTFGKAKSIISPSRQNDIADAIYSDVKAGNLNSACNDFVTLSADAYQVGESTRVPKIIGISLGIGAVAALIATLIVILSYRKKKRSPSYPLKEFSELNLTVSEDICTGRNVTKVRLSSSSGSGGSRGGGGGRSSGRR